jgi:hypothetical protein
MRQKISDDFNKLHLTQTFEKTISKQVINIFSHAFAPHARIEEGVILNGN